MEYDPSSNPQNAANSGATEQTKQQTQQIAHQARQKADELATQGTQQIKSQLANRKHQAAQRMTPVQTALRETAQQLRNQGQGSVAEYADGAAGQVERFSGYLRETDVDQITEEARGFARRQPALFLGGAAVLGFLGTRFLKSTSRGGASAQGGPTVSGGGAVTHGSREPAPIGPPAVGEEPVMPAERRPLGEGYGQREGAEPPGSPGGRSDATR